MLETDRKGEQNLITQIVEIHLEVMNGKVHMSHTHIEFRLTGGGYRGGKFSWYESDGTTEMGHPDFEELDFSKRIEIEWPFRERIVSLLEEAREHDKDAGVPIRNVFDMIVDRDGGHEFKFYHDAELVAVQSARIEESERKEAELRQKKQAEFDALSEEEKQATLASKAPYTTEGNTLDRYEILRQKIYRNEDNIWHAEEFLRYQASLAAPEGWEEIRIEMAQVGETKTRMDQWYRLKGESEFKQLFGRAPMDVVDAIEHWRVRKDEGKHRDRNVRFTISPEDVEMHYAIRYEWDI